MVYPVLPDFNSEGLLPTGDYPMTLDQLRQSSLTVAPKELLWDTEWRMKLIDNLEILANQLWQVGIKDIFIDGSFVESKAHPNDIDGYFHCDSDYFASGELARNLNLIDPYKVWTWSPRSRSIATGHAKRQLPMWHHYRVELFPHYGQSCGITDEDGNELDFPAAFRMSRTWQPKGIVQLMRRT